MDVKVIVSSFLIGLGGAMISSKSTDWFGKILGLVLIIIAVVSYIAQL